MGWVFGHYWWLVGALAILWLLLVMLRVADIITWSWWFVNAPGILALAMVVIYAILYLVLFRNMDFG